MPEETKGQAGSGRISRSQEHRSLSEKASITHNTVLTDLAPPPPTALTPQQVPDLGAQPTQVQQPTQAQSQPTQNPPASDTGG